MSDMLQLVVGTGNYHCAELQAISLLSVANLDDKLKHVGHWREGTLVERFDGTTSNTVSQCFMRLSEKPEKTIRILS
ncbi:MAG TPA: hypothetical protein VF074_02685, partial [Pyrinomonadaceae bacterium]